MQAGAGEADMVSAAFRKFVRAAACVAWFVPLAAVASEGGPRLQTAPINSHDLASLQNGAKLFVNYCLNCHTASYMRYNRLHDIGLTDADIKKNLLFAGDKVGDTIK